MSIALVVALCGCGRAPGFDGQFVYVDQQGEIVARDLATGTVRVLASGVADGDLALDRQGTKLIHAATREDGVREIVRRHLITGIVEPLCQARYPDRPVTWGSPAFSAGGDLAAFTTHDATGTVESHLAHGIGHCAPVASGIRSVDWAPGGDRMLLANEKALAPFAVTNTLSPALPPGTQLTPIWKSDDAIRDISVDRLYERFAILTTGRVIVRGFSSRASEMATTFADLHMGEAVPDPVSACFSPDGERVAVVFGPRAHTRVRVYGFPKTGGEVADLGELNLEPPPAPAQVAWAPMVLGPASR